MIDEVFDTIEKVVDIVDQAVINQDYSTMSRDIGNLFQPDKRLWEEKSNKNPYRSGQTGSGAPKGGRPYEPYQVPGRQKVNNGRTGYRGMNSRQAQSMNRQSAPYGARQNGQSAARPINRTAKQTVIKRQKIVFDKPSNVGSTLQVIAGCVCAATCLIPAVPFLVSGYSYLLTRGLFLVGAGVACGIFGISGLLKLRRNRRIEKYRALLGDKMYADVHDMADAVNKTDKAVVAELRQLVTKKVFPQGHFDAGRKTFMATDDLYQQYKAVTAQTKALKKVQEEQEKEFSNLDPDVRDMIVKGGEFVKMIHESNDDIADPIVSEKLDRMEAIVAKLFEEVREKPEQAHRLNMLMDYYLPTTGKLISAYRDMIHQPIQGENILKAEKEIESTLDTINDAFEKLLDSFFADAAMDVSTDISVMTTMMKRQGLTEDGLRAEGPSLKAEAPTQRHEGGARQTEAPTLKAEPVAGYGATLETAEEEKKEDKLLAAQGR